MRDNTHRFTGKGAVYAAARPRYAEGLFEFLASCPNAAPGSVIADIGSGTGIFSEQLIEHGWEVVGVEPNDDMRAQAERRLGNTGMFESVRATADRTGLPAHSVDCVTAAQAFHWFDVGEFSAVIEIPLSTVVYAGNV